MLQISDFGRSDRDLHHRSDNSKVRGIRGGAFSIPQSGTVLFSVAVPVFVGIVVSWDVS